MPGGKESTKMAVNLSDVLSNQLKKEICFSGASQDFRSRTNCQSIFRLLVVVFSFYNDFFSSKYNFLIKNRLLRPKREFNKNLKLN